MLPKETTLGKFKMVEVFEYYDRPVLFSCTTENGRIFVAVLENEDEVCDEWLYVEVSPKRYSDAISGRVDLYNLFKQSEDGFVYYIKTYKDETRSGILKEDCKNLEDKQLPERGQFIKIY